MNRIPKLKKEKEKISIRIITGKSKNDFLAIVIRTENDSIKNEFLRIAGLLPEFTYYYRHGEAIKMIYTLPIIIRE